MIRRLLALVLLAGALLAPPAWARQDDPRLDPLFERLAATDDDNEAALIANQIWSIWIETGDPALDRVMARGVVAMRLRQLDAALESFDYIIETDADFAEGWNKRATVYFLMGRYEDSIRDVERVLALEPRHFGALSGMGLILSELGEDGQALDWFERALAINPHLQGIRERVRAIKAKLRGDDI